MKICPQCQTSYTDDSLQYCLQDGTPLISSPVTNNWTESETLVSPRQTDKMRVEWQNQPSQNVPVSRETIVAAPPKKSNTALIVALTAIVTLLVAGAGVVGFLYFKRGNKKEVVNINSKSPVNIAVPNVAQNSNENLNVNSNVNQTPTATPTPKPTINPKEADEIKSDVKDLIEEWNDAIEDHNLNAHLDKYADTVDYYKTGNVGVGKIRADKQRAFETYDDIDIDISNLKITPDETGEKATAVFDKEWKFEGEEKFSSGKVQQQLQLAKINGKWRITGEKDLKVYYVEK